MLCGHTERSPTVNNLIRHSVALVFFVLLLSLSSLSTAPSARPASEEGSLIEVAPNLFALTEAGENGNVAFLITDGGAILTATTPGEWNGLRGNGELGAGGDEQAPGSFYLAVKLMKHWI